jgi:Na+-transporting methylmalonyl-CoA/oxaloacetate decarboxylase gamma subunit
MKEVIWISLIGAGLVILGLMVLWLMMDLLVRFTTDRKTKNAEVVSPSVDTADTTYQQKAAAAATAVAMALSKSSFLLIEDQSDKRLTAWQSAHRHNQLHNQPNSATLKRNHS